MTETNDQPKTAETQMSPEQVQERKALLMKSWEQDKSWLTAQLEHQRMLTELDELRTRSIIAQVQMANIMAPEPQEDKPEQPRAKTHESATVRTLKKDLAKDTNVSVA